MTTKKFLSLLLPLLVLSITFQPIISGKPTKMRVFLGLCNNTAQCNKSCISKGYEKGICFLYLHTCFCYPKSESHDDPSMSYPPN
ncbi:hypothetical protein CARUB_v10021497mg [Capsella rubella]|uniref:Knottins-like domain-containing protein n=1 Tax=Capsella rubella TaxID=81985 RepID=R0GEG8_9BRAS|nr:hypothetical protein CARUB_v10021497mg [Capsella rubella]